MTTAAQQIIFNEWLNGYQALLFKVVRAYAMNAADRDDLFQEICLQVWRSVPSFRQESAVSTWLYRIALNTAIRWVKKEYRNSPPQALENVQHILHENIPAADDRLAWLYKEIYRFNEIDRSLILLLLDDFSYREMAAILGISETNVGVKISRIKKYLIAQSKKNYHHGI